MTNTLIGEIGIDTKAGSYNFRPSFYNLAQIGTPEEIVNLFNKIQSGNRSSLVTCHNIIESCCVEKPDADSGLDELLGMWLDNGGHIDWLDGELPISDTFVIAITLLKSGLIGKPNLITGKGKASKEWDASEYVGAAVAHLNLSTSDAWNMTMIEFQRAIESKFPDAGDKKDDYPTAEEHAALIKLVEG